MLKAMSYGGIERCEQKDRSSIGLHFRDLKRILEFVGFLETPLCFSALVFQGVKPTYCIWSKI